MTNSDPIKSLVVYPFHFTRDELNVMRDALNVYGSVGGMWHHIKDRSILRRSELAEEQRRLQIADQLMTELEGELITIAHDKGEM